MVVVVRLMDGLVVHRRTRYICATSAPAVWPVFVTVNETLPSAILRPEYEKFV